MKKFDEILALHVPLQNLCTTEQKEEHYSQCIITSTLPLHFLPIWVFSDWEDMVEMLVTPLACIL